MVGWLAACVRHLAGRSGDTPAPPERQEKAGNPVIDWHYALSVAYATQGKRCLSPLTDAERLALFPEVLLPETPRTRDRLPYRTCGHAPEKRTTVARLYRQEEAASASMAILAASPETLRGVVRHWQYRVNPDDLADMLAQWQECQPELTDIRAAKLSKKSPADLRPEYPRVA